MKAKRVLLQPDPNTFGGRRKERLQRRAYRIAEAWQRQEAADDVVVTAVEHTAQGFMAGYRAAVADMRMVYEKADKEAGLEVLAQAELEGIIRDFIKPMR